MSKLKEETCSIMCLATSRISLTDRLKREFIWDWYFALQGHDQYPHDLAQDRRVGLAPVLSSIEDRVSGLYSLMNIE